MSAGKIVAGLGPWPLAALTFLLGCGVWLLWRGDLYPSLLRVQEVMPARGRWLRWLMLFLLPIGAVAGTVILARRGFEPCILLAAWGAVILAEALARDLAPEGTLRDWRDRLSVGAAGLLSLASGFGVLLALTTALRGAFFGPPY